MTAPTLTQIFGTNATQTATQLVISKADLATVGLTVSSANTGSSLLVALVLLWQSFLTTTNQSNNIDQNVTVEDGFSSIVIRGNNNTNYRQSSKTINFQKVDSAAGIDPDDY